MNDTTTATNETPKLSFAEIVSEVAHELGCNYDNVVTRVKRIAYRSREVSGAESQLRQAASALENKANDLRDMLPHPASDKPPVVVPSPTPSASATGVDREKLIKAMREERKKWVFDDNDDRDDCEVSADAAIAEIARQSCQHTYLSVDQQPVTFVNCGKIEAPTNPSPGMGGVAMDEELVHLFHQEYFNNPNLPKDYVVSDGVKKAIFAVAARIRSERVADQPNDEMWQNTARIRGNEIRKLNEEIESLKGTIEANEIVIKNFSHGAYPPGDLEERAKACALTAWTRLGSETSDGSKKVFEEHWKSHSEYREKWLAVARLASTWNGVGLPTREKLIHLFIMRGHVGTLLQARAAADDVLSLSRTPPEPQRREAVTAKEIGKYIDEFLCVSSWPHWSGDVRQAVINAVNHFAAPADKLGIGGGE